MSQISLFARLTLFGFSAASMMAFGCADDDGVPPPLGAGGTAGTSVDAGGASGADGHAGSSGTGTGGAAVDGGKGGGGAGRDGGIGGAAGRGGGAGSSGAGGAAGASADSGMAGSDTGGAVDARADVGSDGSIRDGGAACSSGPATGKTCVDYCNTWFMACQPIAMWASTYPDPATCLSACASWPEAKLCCRVEHVGNAVNAPNPNQASTHCGHAAGVAGPPACAN